MQITMQKLLSLSIKPAIRSIHKWHIRQQIVFWELEKQIIIDNREHDYRREKLIDKMQAIRQADLNLLERM